MDAMVQDVIQRAQTVHQVIAEALCPTGDAGQMLCRVGCGNAFEIMPDDVARYIRHGWPRCCGREMRWEQTT